MFNIMNTSNIIIVVSSDLSEVLFVVLSQSNVYHAGRAEAFRSHFREQVTQLGVVRTNDKIIIKTS